MGSERHYLALFPQLCAETYPSYLYYIVLSDIALPCLSSPHKESNVGLGCGLVQQVWCLPHKWSTWAQSPAPPGYLPEPHQEP